MRTRQQEQFLAGTVTLLAFCAAAWAEDAAEAPADFRVFPETSYQTMSGFGAGICENTLKDMQALSPKDRERLYDLVFGEDGLRLNIIRIHISPNAQPFSTGAALRGQGLRYDWEHDANTQNVYQAIAPALKHSRVMLYAVPFTPPRRWKSNKQPTWGGSLLRENYRDYAEYLADFVAYYQKVRSLTIDILSLQNEPDVAIWWDSCRWKGSELNDFLEEIASVFRRQRLSTKFMLSEGSTWDQAWMHVAPALADAQSRPLLGILASHSYGDDDLVDEGRDLFRAAATQHEIPVWMSEMSIIGPPDDPSIDAALKIAHLMYRDIVHGGAAAWIYCQMIFTPEFRGSMGVVSPATATSGLVVPKRFWAMANYSHFVRPGWKRIRIDGLAFANSAFVSPQGDHVAIVAMNASGNVRPATYHFGDGIVSSIEIYVTSHDSNLSRTMGPVSETNALQLILAPRSVTTIVGKLRLR
jgi:glucuronoarabinoxylan endo-1,4-beta-xylanase